MDSGITLLEMLQGINGRYSSFKHLRETVDAKLVEHITYIPPRTKVLDICDWLVDKGYIIKTQDELIVTVPVCPQP